MLRVSAAFVVGLATATCLLPAEAGAEVAVIRCETRASGHIEVTHWTLSSDVDVDIGDGNECAETVATLLRAGYRLPFGLTTSPSGFDRRDESLTFVFFAGLGFRTGFGGSSQLIPPSASAKLEPDLELPKEVGAFRAAVMQPQMSKTVDTKSKRTSVPSKASTD